MLSTEEGNFFYDFADDKCPLNLVTDCKRSFNFRLIALYEQVECDEIEDWIDSGDNMENMPEYSPCLNTWVTIVYSNSGESFLFTFYSIFKAITQSLVLAICTSFLFVRIHFILKLFIGIFVVGFYSWIIFDEYDFLYEVNIILKQAISNSSRDLFLTLN